MTGPETRRRLYAARAPAARSVSVQRNRFHAGSFKSRMPAKKKARTQPAPKEWPSTHNGEGLCSPTNHGYFYLKRVDGRKRVWRRRKERHVPVTVIPTVAFQGGGVMVWAGISATAKTDLVFIEGILNAQR